MREYIASDSKRKEVGGSGSWGKIVFQQRVFLGLVSLIFRQACSANYPGPIAFPDKDQHAPRDLLPEGVHGVGSPTFHCPGIRVQNANRRHAAGVTGSPIVYRRRTTLAYCTFVLDLSRMPMGMVVPAGPRYATLPLPPSAYAPQLYYPAPEAATNQYNDLDEIWPRNIYYVIFMLDVRPQRMRRRRSPRAARTERQRRGRARRDDSQLTRSLERIHRKRRSDREHPTVDDLKRTYTGLDSSKATFSPNTNEQWQLPAPKSTEGNVHRAYAEQFIAVCDESRHAAEAHDSLASSATDDTSHSQHST
ncbi:jg21258 [Pararge aegeria aegeria]|uniref:Jg21258 protein n=1 Tax=Pararge aegeria aegeria TaxID=348720 RepID=A0A8S4RIV6_9NEOP|nr:jg21258 [Pararge aegeria aegeria]